MYVLREINNQAARQMNTFPTPLLMHMPTFPQAGPKLAMWASITSLRSSRSAHGQLLPKAGIFISLERRNKDSPVLTYKHFPGILFDTSPAGP